MNHMCVCVFFIYRLQRLRISNTKITDKGMTSLAGLFINNSQEYHCICTFIEYSSWLLSHDTSIGLFSLRELYADKIAITDDIAAVLRSKFCDLVEYLFHFLFYSVCFVCRFHKFTRTEHS